MSNSADTTVKQFALTTFDNPYDPFDQFDQWFLYDVEHGYDSCSYLARIARTSDLLTEDENNKEIERAIDEIIMYDFMNVYTKVERKSKESDASQSDSEQNNNEQLV